MIQCMLCGKRIKDGEPVLSVGKLVANEKRGDFVSYIPDSYVHLYHLTQLLGRTT